MTDAGPLLSLATTSWFAPIAPPQQACRRRLQANYDGLEARIAELAAKEDLARVRPDLDGNEIMRFRWPRGPR